MRSDWVHQFTLTNEAAIPSIPSERRTFAPLFARLTPGFAGLYQVNFLAPAPPPAVRSWRLHAIRRSERQRGADATWKLDGQGDFLRRAVSLSRD